MCTVPSQNGIVQTEGGGPIGWAQVGCSRTLEVAPIHRLDTCMCVELFSGLIHMILMILIISHHDLLPYTISMYIAVDPASRAHLRHRRVQRRTRRVQLRANAVGVEGLEAFRLRPRLPTFASFGGGEERFTKLSAQCIAEQPQQPATWDPVPSNPFDDETFAYDVDDHIKAKKTGPGMTA